MFLIFINSILLSIILFLINILFFSNILNSNKLIFYFYNFEFIISNSNSSLLNFIFKTYQLFSFYTFILLSFYFLKYFFNSITFTTKERSPPDINTLNILIGFNDNKLPIYLYENDLYQNILITGAIGSGKTSSAMYPFSEQLISSTIKISMLILDVKGNYNTFIKSTCIKYNRLSDYIELSFDSDISYNPLDKPNLKSLVLAQRLKQILKLFSPETTESFWLDKAEEVLSNAINLCRLYNNNYVNFEEIHKLINNQEYLDSKLSILRKLFILNNFSDSENYNLLNSINFFKNEFFKLDLRTLSIIKSEINRITSVFISDYNTKKIFSPQNKSDNNINIKEIIKSHKILLFNININEYNNLSKILSAYLKMDFQDEVLLQASSSDKIYPTAFICDEYHEYCTKNDANFFSQSRESKCINIVCTQSYSSILNTLKDETCLNMILQNFINKIWFRTDDIYSIEKIQKLIGKEDKEKVSSSFTENSNHTSYNLFTKNFLTNDSSFSQSTNTYYQYDFIYDYNYFTRNLSKFTALCYLCNNGKTSYPICLNMQPYFLKGEQKNEIFS